VTFDNVSFAYEPQRPVLLREQVAIVLQEALLLSGTVRENLGYGRREAAAGQPHDVVIAHRLSTVRSADRILVIEAGVLVDSGTHDDLVRRCPLYATLAGEFADAA